MQGPTHALVGAASAAVFLIPGVPHHLPLIALSAVSGFSALLPDLDNTESTIENIRVLGVRLLKGPAFVIDKLFKHRGFLHSLLAVALLACILLGFLPQIPHDVDIAILVGYLSHIVADALTPEGIPWLYPVDARWSLLPNFLCITTGSFMERLFFIVMIVVYVLFLSGAGYIILPR